MSDTRDLASVLAAADQAAAAGDHVSAEKLLREAAALQEASLGPLHPDLANTLNNLAVVCEMTNRPADAERYYRKAAAIAAASLAADHPFVATSRKNLEEFCAARGIPVEPPVMRLAPVPTQPKPQPPARPSYAPPRMTRPARRTNPIAIGAAIVGGVVIVMLVASRTWTSDAPSPSKPIGAAAPSASSAPATIETRSPAATARGRGAAAPENLATIASGSAAPPGVVNARLCRAITTGTVDWSCEAPATPIGRGPVYFYTRLTAPRDTTVQHRWYRDGQLQRVVDLSISANMGRGYRTYSRSVLDSFSVGEWRVELRSAAGALLHEERFDVR